jgi:hypothetical protein
LNCIFGYGRTESKLDGAFGGATPKKSCNARALNYSDGSSDSFLDDTMRGMLRERSRVRAAFVVAALYALCVLAPHAALSLGHAAAHCLTEERPAAAHVHKAKAETASHTHADGTVHHHGGIPAHHGPTTTDPHQHSDADGKSDSGNCCGLFCISAIALETGVAMPALPLVAADLSSVHDALRGHSPGRVNRPPIG